VEITVSADKSIETRERAFTPPKIYSPKTVAKREEPVAANKTAPPRPAVASVNPEANAHVAAKYDQNMQAIKSELLRLRASFDSLKNDIRRTNMTLLPDTYRFLEEEKGVEPEMASELIQNAFLKLEGGDIKDRNKVFSKLRQEIAKSIAVDKAVELKLDGSVLIFLVGPTGAGKTTSIIKMATNPLLYGKHRVGLITIDTYRVAAAAQLKTFAALSRLPLEIVYNCEDFSAALARLSDCDVILVDTAGRSPLNREHLADMQDYCKIARPDKMSLVLSASMRSDIVMETALNFQTLPITDLVVTKIDETRKLGNIYNVGKKIQLPISFLTNGQKVPDDIEVADKNAIANLILNEC